MEQSGIGWYPRKPVLDGNPGDVSKVNVDASAAVDAVASDALCIYRYRAFQGACPQNTSGWIPYLIQNDWSLISSSVRETTLHLTLPGVEVKQLHSNHPIVINSGIIEQYGLFATKHFDEFDPIGEYCGKMTTAAGGVFVAQFDTDVVSASTLSVDAAEFGNELRFINSFRNGVAEAPNALMRTCYVDGQPRIILLCCKHIDPGDEILLDYGESYDAAYITAK